MEPVESSNVSAIGYDGETRTLVVEFKGGSRYSYANVTPEVHTAIMSAESKGRALATSVLRSPKDYPFTRLEP